MFSLSLHTNFGTHLMMTLLNCVVESRSEVDNELIFRTDLLFMTRELSRARDAVSGELFGSWKNAIFTKGLARFSAR